LASIQIVSLIFNYQAKKIIYKLRLKNNFSEVCYQHLVSPTTAVATQVANYFLTLLCNKISSIIYGCDGAVASIQGVRKKSIPFN